MPSREELKLLQALPLELKIEKTKARIREWVKKIHGANYHRTNMQKYFLSTDFMG